MSYCFSKIWETIHSKRLPHSLATSHVEFLEKCLENFKQALKKRDLWEASESIRYLYEELDYPISELKKYFQGEDDSESANKRAVVNCFFVEKKIEELKEIAKEIDEDYAQNESEKVKRINYKGEIGVLKYKKPDPELLGFLTDKDCLLVLRHCEPPYKVVLGVPHQAAIGQERICEKRKDKNGRPDPRDSDENAASYALVAFAALREHDVPCKLVIMAHSTTKDPNKDSDTPYWEEIFQNDTKLLFECHGLGEDKKLDLELSAGPNDTTDTKKYGQLLDSALNNLCDLGVQKEAGKKDAIIYRKDGTKDLKGELQKPGTETGSLKEAQKRKLPSLHLEAKPRFRIPEDKSNTVTPDGLILGQALAQVIIKFSSE